MHPADDNSDDAVATEPSTARLPRPAFLSPEWLTAHGVPDGDEIWRAMRPESLVMRPERLRAIKASRLSFARSLMQTMIDGRWRIGCRLSELDSHGAGLLIYEIEAEQHLFSFVVVSSASDGTDRLGRFYETQYDFYGSILEGRVSPERAKREAAEMETRVWSGRTDNESLGWTVANRSNRFFDYVVAQLAAGHQPDTKFLASGGGYIVRNAGWYGNGRHGSRSWLSLPADHPFAHPYHLDVFALYLWRTVSCDVAEAVARARSAVAVPLQPAIKKYLGIGNSSGIGMVAALVRWPAWLGTFHLVRELAIAYAVTRKQVQRQKIERLADLLGRAGAYYAEQPGSAVSEVEEPGHLAEGLRALEQSTRRLLAESSLPPYPWATLVRRSQQFGSAELEEQLNALLIEVESDFADRAASLLPEGMRVRRTIDPRMTVAELMDLVHSRYAWAMALDLAAPGARAHFWYKSEENGENRRGERDIDPGVENETFVDVAGTVQALTNASSEQDPATPVGEFLLMNPQFSHVVSRIQLAARIPYSEVQANIIDRGFLPMDGIRFLLSTLGLESSSPHSTRWVRGVFFQGAPLPEDINQGTSDDYIFPHIQ